MRRFLQSIRIFCRCIIIYSFAYEYHACFIKLGFVQIEHLAIAMPTRMHSSRMRTSRSLTACRSLLPGGGVCSWGGLLLGGLLLGRSAPGGGAVCSWGGGVIPACTEADPLWTESQTPVKTLLWPNFVAAGKHG